MRIGNFLPSLLLGLTNGCADPYGHSGKPATGDAGNTMDVDSNPPQPTIPATPCIDDNDGDSYCRTSGWRDCNDNDPSIHPWAEEICDGIDNDCDRQTDENCPTLPDPEPDPSRILTEWDCDEGTRGCGTCDLGTQNCIDGFWEECLFEPSVEAIQSCECSEEGSAIPSGILFIVDAGGGMFLNEYVVARTDMARVMTDYSDRIDFGMVLFPEPPQYTCEISDNQLPIGSDPQQIIDTLNSRGTLGTTPTAAAVEKGVDLIRDYQNLHDQSNLAVVMISCGGDSCQGDPMEAFQSLVDTGVQTYLIEMAAGTFAGMANTLQASGLFNYYNTWDDYAVTLGPMLNSIIVGEVFPKVLNLEEVCDGLDNDCDGQIDEGFESFSYGGPANTLNKGVCKAEIRDCVYGDIERVQERQLPSEERCDGQDNDCDGVVDDGVGVRQGCKPIQKENACAFRSYTLCNEEGAVICFTPEPTPEICNGNGIDDDCNGQIDDMGDIPCTPPDPDTGIQPPNFIRFTRPAKNIENPVVDTVAVMPDSGHWNLNEENNLTASWLMTDQGREYSCTVLLRDHRGDQIDMQNSVLSNGTPQPEGRELSVTFRIPPSHFKPLHKYTLVIPECRNEAGDTAIVGATTTFYTRDNNLAFGYLFFPGDRVIDVSGHGLDLELRGNPPPTLLPSDEVQFDGIQNYLESGGETLLGLDALWNIFLIQKINQNRSQAMYTIGSTDGENSYRSYTDFSSDDSGFLRMNHYGDSGQLAQPISRGPRLIPGRWQDIAITSDDRFAPGPATLQYYMDGASIEMRYEPESVFSHQHDRPRRILLGAAREDGRPSRYMNGSLKAFLVYNTLKDPSQVYQVMVDLMAE